MLTLCVFPIYITPRPSLQSYIMHAVKGGVIYIGNTQHLILVSVLFSPVIPISYQNICKIFLFTSLYPFFSPNFEQSKVNNILFFFVNSQCTSTVGVIGSRFATLLQHSLVQLCSKFKACGLYVDSQIYCNWFTKESLC